MMVWNKWIRLKQLKMVLSCLAMILVQLIVITHALKMNHHLPPSTSSSSTTFQGQNQPFTWEAELDAKTGLASSREDSSFQMISQTKTTGTVDHIRGVSEKFVATWPYFVCKGSVTFGLFRAAAKDKNKNRTSSNTICIQPRFLPVSLLGFGKPQRQQKTNLVGKPRQQMVGMWEIPLKGGLLALVPHKGKLVFSISKTMKAPEKGAGTVNDIYQISTQIVDYQPWLAGHPPVSSIRKWLYLSTQSHIHAYITWRFHKAWKDEISCKQSMPQNYQ
mmetsp:Transcript_15453/g.28764  ORF Transcript_15453/g.28764 Transcript_15453/m.28764 type:complete len:275 (+) Transcript_15453:195-1019(+)